MKWKAHLLYDNGIRIKDAVVHDRTYVDIDEKHTMTVFPLGVDGKPGGPRIKLEHAELRCWTQLGSLYFSGYQTEPNGMMVYQAIMLEPAKDYDSRYDSTYRYPLTAAGPFYRDGDELPLFFELDDCHRLNAFRLEDKQIAHMLRSIHKACGKHFEAWLRREILGEKDDA